MQLQSTSKIHSHIELKIRRHTIISSKHNYGFFVAHEAAIKHFKGSLSVLALPFYMINYLPLLITISKITHSCQSTESLFLFALFISENVFLVTCIILLINMHLQKWKEKFPGELQGGHNHHLQAIWAHNSIKSMAASQQLQHNNQQVPCQVQYSPLVLSCRMSEIDDFWPKWRTSMMIFMHTTWFSSSQSTTIMTISINSMCMTHFSRRALVYSN